MNEWPDELWRNEPFLTRAIHALSANVADEEIDDSQYTTEYIVPWAVIGASLILCFSAVTVSLAATAGLSITLIRLRRKGFGFAPGGRHA